MTIDSFITSLQGAFCYFLLNREGLVELCHQNNPTTYMHMQIIRLDEIRLDLGAEVERLAQARQDMMRRRQRTVDCSTFPPPGTGGWVGAVSYTHLTLPTKA